MGIVNKLFDNFLSHLPDELFGNKSSNGANSKLYSACNELGPCHCGNEKPRRDLVDPWRLPIDLPPTKKKRKVKISDKNLSQNQIQR